jgi:hypothetical protein
VVKRNPLKLVGYSPPLENGLQVLNACSTWITSLNEARTRDALCKTLSSLFTKGKKPFESFVEKVTPFLPSVKDLKFPSTFLINLLTYLDTHQADVVQPFFAFKSPTNQNVCSNCDYVSTPRIIPTNNYVLDLQSNYATSVQEFIFNSVFHIRGANCPKCKQPNLNTQLTYQSLPMYAIMNITSRNVPRIIDTKITFQQQT